MFTPNKKPSSHDSLIDNLKQAALDYHAHPKPGKIGLELIKATNTQRELSLAYTPGVAEPVMEIVKDPQLAYQYTTKGNLVGIVSNGTAVLGLGDVGALASKPVMEGKAVLFKRFANLDAFDIEIQTKNPDDFIQTVINIAPTFGAINLEDIKAPECFYIEQALKEQLNIPVFHDDQHGTAIIIAAALLNALLLQNKQLSDIDIVCLGAGAAGIASCKLLIKLGANPERLLLLDRHGVINQKRKDLNAYKAEMRVNTPKSTLEEAARGADVLIGVSGPNLISANVLKSLAPNPIVFALSNPKPEIDPQLAHNVRDDLILATGRSDYPNQVNNVLCFPYILRGALEARATSISDQMKIAAVHAIRALAQQPVPKVVMDAYPSIQQLSFGSNYIIPKPMDPRLLSQVTSAIRGACA